MPYETIEGAFLNFITGFELTEQNIGSALAKSQQLIELARRKLKVRGAFLGGSYRRGTGIIFDKLKLQLVLGSKYYYDFRENSTKLLYFLKKSLPDSADNVFLHGEKIVFRINSPGIDLELIPSIKLKSAGYLSPNGLGGWYRTNPDKEEELFKVKDNASSGRFLPLVKVIKAWNIFAAG